MLLDGTRFAALLMRLYLLFRRPAQAVLDPNANVMGWTRNKVAVEWPRARREAASHVALFAASGTGKTVLLAESLTNEWLMFRASKQPGTLVVVTAKEDLAVHCLEAIAAKSPEALSAITLLDPFSPGAFGLNVTQLARPELPDDIFALLLAHRVAEVSGAQVSGGAGVGGRQLHALTNVILGALAVDDPRASIMLARDALVLPDGLKALAAVTQNRRAKETLENMKLSDELRISSAARLEAAFSATERLERIMTAPPIDLDRLMAPGAMLLISLSAPPGGLAPLVKLWATLLAGLVFERALARPSPYEGGFMRIAVDEAHLLNVLAPAYIRALTVGRSKKVGLVLATQSPSLLQAGDEPLLAAILGNSTRIIGRLPARDAEALAREGHGLGDRAAVAATMTGLPDRHFIYAHGKVSHRFVAKDLDLAAWQTAAASHTAAIEGAAGRVALAPDDAERLRLRDLLPASDAPEPGRRGRRRSGPDLTVVGREADTDSEPRSRWG